MEQELKDKLNELVPAADVKQKPGGGGRTLDYVDRHYVITTLNELFGHDGWTSRTCVELAGDRFIAECSLTVDTEKYRFERSDVGECLLQAKYGTNENAAAEAATQALKRAASQIGNRLGLNLYSDERASQGQQTHIDPNPDRPADQDPPPRRGNVDFKKMAKERMADSTDYADLPPHAREALERAEGNQPGPVPMDVAVNVSFRFGNNKGQPLGSMGESSLKWYKKVAIENIRDPKKKRFMDKTVKELDAICAVLHTPEQPPLEDMDEMPF